METNNTKTPAEWSAEIDEWAAAQVREDEAIRREYEL